MDINLTRTFIEIADSGSFVGAAHRLNVTQSTVSARIRNLEDQLGRRLFVRKKSGAVLTPAGEQFQRYALTMVHVWEQARHHIAMPLGYEEILSIGGQVSLWDGLLTKWLAWMRNAAPEVSIQAEYGLPDSLMIRLVEGVLDIGVMYLPQNRPGLKVQKLFEDKLVLVSSGSSADDFDGSNYVLMDWGPEFRKYHSLNYPELSNVGMSFSLGSHGLQYVLDSGGSGYFPERLVRPFEAEGRLTRVKSAPSFSLPAYVIYTTDGDKKWLAIAIKGLREIANLESKD